jgi:hypothetical protein
MPNFSLAVYHQFIAARLLNLQEKLILQNSEIKYLESQLIQSLQDFISLGHQNLMLTKEILDLKAERRQ